MSSELLHEILINGLYSRLEAIDRIISREGNLHTLILDCELKCSMRTNEDPYEIHVKKIIFKYVPGAGAYKLIFDLMHGEILLYNEDSMRKAFDKAITDFGFGKFKYLIPPTIPEEPDDNEFVCYTCNKTIRNQSRVAETYNNELNKFYCMDCAHTWDAGEMNKKIANIVNQDAKDEIHRLMFGRVNINLFGYFRKYDMIILTAFTIAGFIIGRCSTR